MEEHQQKGNQTVLKRLVLEREVHVMKYLASSFGLADYGISIGPMAKSVLPRLRRILNLLVFCSVMDYRLLVGVVDLDCTDSSISRMDQARKDELEKILNKMSIYRKKSLVSLTELIAAPLK